MNRIRLFGACIAIGGAAFLAGCVAYPAGPYYNGAVYSGAYPYYSYPYSYPYYSNPYYPYWGWGGSSVVIGGVYGSGYYRPYYGGRYPYWGHGGWNAGWRAKGAGVVVATTALGAADSGDLASAGAAALERGGLAIIPPWPSAKS